MQRRSIPVALGDLTIRVAAIDDLIALKRAAGRPVDLDDIAVLADLQRLERGIDLDASRREQGQEGEGEGRAAHARILAGA